MKKTVFGVDALKKKKKKKICSLKCYLNTDMTGLGYYLFGSG